MPNMLNFNEDPSPAEVVDQLEKMAGSGASVRITRDELEVVIATIVDLVGLSEDLMGQLDEMEEELLKEELDGMEKERLKEELEEYEPDVEPVVEGEDEG